MASLVTVTRGGKKGKGKRVYGLEGILTELRKRRRALDDRSSNLSVGYSAPYAAAVHERLHVPHKNGQAKFLEQPMRTEAPAMAAIIRARLRAHDSLKLAQMAAANHLMKVSLTLVPRLTGHLASSWFIRGVQGQR